MDTFHWRTKARYIALYDMTLKIIYLVIVVGPLLQEIYATATVGFKDDKYFNHKQGVRIFMWILMGILTFGICLDLWMSIILVKATKRGADPNQAFNRAVVWQNVAIVMMALNAAYSLLNGSLLVLVVTLILVILRSINVCIVHLFIEELWEVLLSLYESSTEVSAV